MLSFRLYNHILAFAFNFKENGKTRFDLSIDVY